jgi:tight adherence protein B
MNTTLMLVALTLGITAGLLCWVLIVIGSTALSGYRARFTEQTRFSLHELHLFFDPTLLFLLNLALVSLAAITIWLLSGMVLLGLGGGLLIAPAPRFVFAWLRRRRMAQIEQQLPDALQVIAGGLRAGVALTLALQQLVREGRPPIAQEFELLLRDQRLGRSLDEALDKLARRLPLQSVTLVVSAMRIANETGGSLAEALERTAITVRSQLAMEDKIRSLTAQGRLQAVIVGLMPLALMLVLQHMEPEAMALMWTTPMGWSTLAAIAALEFFGVLLIRRIVSIDV